MGDRVRKNAVFTAHDEAMLAELLGRKKAAQAARAAERKRVDRFCMSHLGVSYADAVKAVEAYKSCQVDTVESAGTIEENCGQSICGDGVVGAMPLPP